MYSKFIYYVDENPQKNIAPWILLNLLYGIIFL